MNLRALLISFVLSISVAHATEFEVVGIDSEVLLRKNIPAVGTVGALTDGVLSDALRTGVVAEYVGSDGGVSSVNGLGNAVEIVSNREMKAYGWCYWVDGVESAKMADEYLLTGRERSIRWFYAYAHLKDNVWIAMCVPADRVAQEFRP